MPFDLTALETRVLGTLMEKERLTPENYPISLNSLTAGCNQTTNREPITTYSEKEIEEGINSLREKKLASMISMAGSRVPKYRHRLSEHFSLEPQEAAVICVLLLRGPQTLGELRTRTDRMFRFAGLQETERCLQELEKDPAGLVSLLPQRPGQKEARYIQNLSAVGDIQQPTLTFDASQPRESSPGAVPLPERVLALEEEVKRLAETLQQVQGELAAFRKQFE